MTHFRTVGGVVAAVISLFISCAPEQDVPSSAALLVDAGSTVESLTEGACQAHSDCALVEMSCCPSCGPAPKSSYVAVLQTKVDEAKQAVCPRGRPSCCACQGPRYDPLAPRAAAACENHHCKVVDLREEELTRCTTDRDCTVHCPGCCALCGNDPSKYLGLRIGADRALLACTAQLPCPPGERIVETQEAFCAADGHCAIKGLRSALRIDAP